MRYGSGTRWLAWGLCVALAAGCDKGDSASPPSTTRPAGETGPAGAAKKGPAPTMNLHDAAIAGNAEQVRRHIAHTSDLNARAEDGKTALAYAADQGHMPVVKLLVEAGADVMARNTGPAGGSTPLHYASGHRDRETMIKYLIAHGADAGAKGMRSATPLHIAAASGYPTNIDLLIAHGAKVDATDDDQATPLHLAARAGSDNATAAAALLTHKASHDAKDKRGLTPLHLAAFEGNLGVLKVLLDGGADVNAKDPKGRTPLYYATRRRRTEAVKLLTARGAK